jgi:hypothetical protein
LAVAYSLVEERLARRTATVTWDAKVSISPKNRKQHGPWLGLGI